MIDLNNEEKQLQKKLLNMTDAELLVTYCHEGFQINEIYNFKKVEIGICSFNFIITNTAKAIDLAKKRVLSHIRCQVKFGRLGC